MKATPPPGSADDIVRFLASVPLFEALSADGVARIAEIVVPRSFAAGDVIFREGDPGDSCYLVRTGRARAMRNSKDGRRITLANFRPGDIFGELALFENETRSATVEATSTVRLLAILRGDMRRLMRTH
ncbi:MAG TPA: cyclic nucleotide-binding domain-containing protein, partial [Solirubrobacteraceae bacterium]|nr:cyclic nucleotide-binding domain-containing protein [Solirubrobacteraceae bacterium]